eukprot:TRINITY_DN60721_c0_g1_i1.p2 TRINITY_DN60721_c0_g1~~TRINITY_DN60721_c0_g1_i1.p2  ORF type:complete len:158 (-),score=24.37 TRINITY_DN60721_c0_g1_i1:48-521(-)
MLKNNPPQAGTFRYKTGHTVLVSGLAPSTRKTDLQGAFGDFGQILRIDVESSKAYIEFEDLRDAQDAISDMDGKMLKERRIRCEPSKTKELADTTPAHGARGVHTVARQGRDVITKEAAPAAGEGRRRSRSRSADRDRRRSRSRRRSAASPYARRRR